MKKKNIFIFADIGLPRRPRSGPQLNAALNRGIADIEAERSLPVGQAFTHIRSKLGLKRKSKRR